MDPLRRWIPATVLAFAVPSWNAIAQPVARADFIAGLTPWQRPAQAPRLTVAPPLDRRVALHGVSEPIPASLRFLDNQGGWYNPFIHPGMPAPYDLRGWHGAPPPAKPRP